MKKGKKMKTTTVDTTQLWDLAGRAAGTGGFLITLARAFSRPGSAVPAGHKLLASAAFGLLLGTPCVADAQQYAFTQIDVPGATETAVNGNSNTAVVGQFDDANGTHGFILRKGTFTTVDIPKASNTRLNGINAAGSFTGTYDDPSAGRQFAFVWRNGVFTRLDPAGSIHSQGGFLNAQGEVVGGYKVPGGTDGRRRAFFWRNGVFTTIDPFPNPTVGPVAFGINDKGQIVGTYQDADSHRHGFLLSKGNYTILDVPGAGNSTVAEGINNAGQIVGLYFGTDGTNHGFVLIDDVYTTVDLPGSTSTAIFSINAKGEIAGRFSDAGGFHGFIGTPVH